MWADDCGSTAAGELGATAAEEVAGPSETRLLFLAAEHPDVPAKTAAMADAVADGLKVLLIVPPVEPESSPRGSSRPGGHVQLLRHFAKGLTALRMVDRLPEHHFFWSDARSFPVLEGG